MWHIYDDVRYTVEQEQNSSLAYTGSPLYRPNMFGFYDSYISLL